MHLYSQCILLIHRLKLENIEPLKCVTLDKSVFMRAFFFFMLIEGIDKNDILQNIDSVKNIITSKFKEKLWCEENLTVKRKLRCHKKVINPNLEYHKYLSVVTSSQKKVNIANIRMNSHELYSETSHWFIPKTPWVERVFHLCESMSVEDENHFLLKCLAYFTLDMSFIVFVTIQTFINS